MLGTGRTGLEKVMEVGSPTVVSLCGVIQQRILEPTSSTVGV